MRPTFILLHPFPLDAEFWTPVAASLAARGGVHAPEFPGFGAAPGAEAPSIDTAADAVARLIADAAPDGRAVVCGVSMGGYIALALAARHPLRVAGLVLSGTHARADAPEARASRLANAARARSGAGAAVVGEIVPRLLPPDADPATLAGVRAIAERQSGAAVAGALEAMAARADRRGDLAGMDVAARVLWGEHDGPVPRDAAAELADGLPHGTLHVVPGAGHLIPVERPAVFLVHALAVASAAS